MKSRKSNRQKSGGSGVVVPPSAYTDGYVEARRRDVRTAENYIRHTTIGDAELDPLMEELSSMPPADLHRYIGAGIERKEDEFRNAPKALRDFFDSVEEPPEWVNFEEFKEGSRAFFKNMTNMLVAYALGSSIEGFSTLVSKSFSITGRVTGLGDGAQRRLRQNNRHMFEVYYPEGMKRDGDGWKVTMRIRFIHARVRNMMAKCKEWDHEAWGTPLSMAHIGGISLYTFSIRQFEHAVKMGSRLSRRQRASIVAIWRYVGHLFGVPKVLQFTNEKEARRLYQIGHICEPPPDEDAITVANTVHKAIPAMLGLKSEAEIKAMQLYTYRLSRALIGNRLADQYGYPRTIPIKIAVLLYYRWLEFVKRFSLGGRGYRTDAFAQIFEATQHDRQGISYNMPDHVHASQSSPW